MASASEFYALKSNDRPTRLRSYFCCQINESNIQASQQHLQQSAVVGGALLALPVAVVHLVPAAGQKQLTGAVQSGRVQRLAVDQADQVLPVVLPSEAQAHQGEYRESTER